VFTSETFIGKPLIENIGTDCEIMSVPLIWGYPHQLISIFVSGWIEKRERGGKITVTPRVVESLY
jgi:hypothetical protein